MGKLSSYIRLVRLRNSILTMVAVLVGALASQLHLFEHLSVLIIAFLSAFFIVMAGFVVNNLYDAPWDALTEGGRKKNPIASGEISYDLGKYLVLLFFSIGFLISIVSWNKLIILLAGLNSILEWIYSKYLKPIEKLTILGNFVLSYLVGSSFYYGLFVIREYSFEIFLSVFLMFLISFLASMGRESLKGIQDIEEDSKRGIGTFAIKYGPKTAGKIGVAFIIIAIMISPIPFLFGYMGMTYFSLIFLVDIYLIIASMFFLFRINSINAKKVKDHYFLAMGVGIIIFGIGVIESSFSVNIIIIPIVLGIGSILTLTIGVYNFPFAKIKSIQNIDKVG